MAFLAVRGITVLACGLTDNGSSDRSDALHKNMRATGTEHTCNGDAAGAA